MDFLLPHLYLFLSISGILFLPGMMALRLLFGKSTPLNTWETSLTAFAVSLGLLDFLMIFLGKHGVLLTPFSIASSLAITIALFSAIRWLSHFMRAKKSPNESKIKTIESSFTRREGILFILIIALTILTKTLYLSDAAFPTSTDLGHHSYWSKVIAETGGLPNYSKREIVVDREKTLPGDEATSVGTKERLSDPEPIADFIIGEHLPFAALALFSGNRFISAFPTTILFLVNILSLLAYFALALRIGDDVHRKFPAFTPVRFGLIILFLLGPIYTLASPQAKFVSGGVVGNTFGNFFIPLILLFFLRSIREKNPLFMGLSFFLTFTLAYTHHLSTLVLLFILVASILAITTLHIHALRSLLTGWIRLLRHPFPLIIGLSCIVFFFTIAMPTYIETHAIGTAIGTPTKTTRLGLTFAEVLSGSGEARSALGIAGLILILFLARSFKNSGGLLIGWSVMLLIMSLAPGLVFLDIPSNRIGSYALFPLSFLAAFAILLIPDLLKRLPEENRKGLPMPLLVAFILIVFGYSITSGSNDNAGSLLSAPKSDEAVQTFAVSQFLSERIDVSDVILKDHNYLSADSFMKLFFMRDYGFPLSRGYFKRYEAPGHEQCSLIMISSPNTPPGKKCFETTGTNIVIVNPLFDRAQFEKSPNFSLIYGSPLVHAYMKHAL